MNPDEPFVRQLETYLDEYEGVTPLPDSVRAALRIRVPRTRQSHPLPRLSRYPFMNLHTPAVRIGLAAVALVIAVIGGLTLLPRGPDAGTPVAPSSAIPSPGATPAAVSPVRGFALKPGPSYRVGEPFELPFTVAFPSRWQVQNVAAGDATFARAEPAEGAPDVSVMLVENVFADPCRDTEPRDPPVGNTVEGVTEGLMSLVGFRSTNLSDASLDGHRGKYFELTNSIDTKTAGCAGGPMLPLFTIRGGGDPPATNGGLIHQIWVIDVDGTVVLVAGWAGVDSAAAFAQEVDAVVDSIRFE